MAIPAQTQAAMKLGVVMPIMEREELGLADACRGAVSHINHKLLAAWSRKRSKANTSQPILIAKGAHELFLLPDLKMSYTNTKAG